MAAPRPTPSLAWSLVHEQDVPVRQAAERLGVTMPELLSLLATYCPPPAPPKPAVRPVPARPLLPVTPAARPGAHRRIDVVEAWKFAETGATAAQIAKAMGFSTEGLERALEREAARRGCPPPTRVAPMPTTTAETAWGLVHIDGLDVRTAARRMRLSPPAVLDLLARQAPSVREREWMELGLAGENPKGRTDWSSQREAHLRSRVAALVAERLPTVLIAERLGMALDAAWRLVNEAAAGRNGS